MLAGGLKPDGGGDPGFTLELLQKSQIIQTALILFVCVSGEVPILNVSYKPQTISPKFKV